MVAKRYAFTILGGIAATVTTLVWIVTFKPHGGSEYSAYLFPLWSWLARALFAGRSVPVLIWYGGALLHWVVLGAAVDIVREAHLRRRERNKSA